MSTPDTHHRDAAPSAVRFHCMVASRRDIAVEVGDQAIGELLDGGPRSATEPEVLTRWWRLRIEVQWWNKLLDTLEHTPAARTDLAAAITAAEDVRHQVELEMLMPPDTIGWAEALPFDVACRLVTTDAHLRFLTGVAQVIAANTTAEEKTA